MMNQMSSSPEALDFRNVRLRLAQVGLCRIWIVVGRVLQGPPHRVSISPGWSANLNEPETHGQKF
jgi:hypothetical protein